MKRRKFLAAMGAAAGAAAGAEQKLLLPSDEPDKHGFRLMWYNPVPPLERASYRLQVGGLVERPRAFSTDDLERYGQVEQSSRMKCVQCWSARASWGGFRFGELLEEVRPRAGATAVRIDCHDKWYEYMSLEEMTAPRVLMALRMNGEPLSDSHGAPLRLIDPSKYGYKSAKLITRITFVEKGEGSMACDIGPYYSPSGEILAGYDHPLDLGRNVRRKISGGEITAY